MPEPSPTDANGYPHAGSPAERAKLHQDVLNESWPQRDRNGYHARDIKPAGYSIAVTVRLVFERDGECFLDGRADRWTRSHVHVALGDPRLQVPGVWVRARDVRRR